MSSHQDDKNKESLVDHREISNETSQTLDNMIIFFLSSFVVHILFGNKDGYTYREALQFRNNQFFFFCHYGESIYISRVNRFLESSHYIHTIHIILNDGIIELRDS